MNNTDETLYDNYSKHQLISISIFFKFSYASCNPQINWEKKKSEEGEQCQTWSVRALVCLVTKKFDKLAEQAIVELRISSNHIYLCCLPRDKVTSNTLGSIIIAAGNNTKTAIGDIQSSKFIEFSFSLQCKRTEDMRHQPV